MQSTETSIVPEVCAKVGSDRLRVPAQKDSEKNQSQQRRNFCGGKNVLNDSARLHSENIDDRERNHHEDGDEVLRVQSNIDAAQNHWSDGELRHFPDVDDPITGGNRRPEDPQEFAECHADRSDRSRLNHEKQSPAVEKTPEWAERLAQIDILPARPRHHSS